MNQESRFAVTFLNDFHKVSEMTTREQAAALLAKDWAENPRWTGIQRNYSAADVIRLRGSLHIEHTLARHGAEKLWKMVNSQPYVNCLGALTGGLFASGHLRYLMKVV